MGEQEIAGNQGFKKKDFDKKMRAVGFDRGMAWCALFTELVWKEAYADQAEYVKLLDKLFSASATSTYKNFDLDERFVCDKTPELGALAVYRYGSDWRGHIGVVVKILDPNRVENVEGNTNDQGGREGYIVTPKPRKILAPYTTKGLNFIGFVHPKIDL